MSVFTKSYFSAPSFTKTTYKQEYTQHKIPYTMRFVRVYAYWNFINFHSTMAMQNVQQDVPYPASDQRLIEQEFWKLMMYEYCLIEIMDIIPIEFICKSGSIIL